MLAVTVWLFALTPLLLYFFRASPPLVLGAATIICLGYLINQKKYISEIQLLMRSKLELSVAALVIYMALSLLWTFDFNRGLIHLWFFTSSLIGGVIVAFVFYQFRVAFPSYIFIGSITLVAILIFLDMNSYVSARVALYLSSEPYRLNRSAVSIVLFLPLALSLLLKENKYFFVFLLLIFSTLSIYSSDSETAKLAFIIVIFVFSLSAVTNLVKPQRVSILIILIVLLMPIIGFYSNVIIPDLLHQKLGYGTLTIRGEVWRETALLVLKKPIFGWGLEASNVLPKMPELQYLSPASLKLLNLGHTHNAILQIWLELGLIGVILLLNIIYQALNALTKVPLWLQSPALSTILGAFVIAGVSHGAWQAWWWCLLSINGVCFVMVSNFYQKSVTSG